MSQAASKTNQAAPRVEGLDFVGLQVRELERSKSFYSQVLGLEALPQERPDAFVFRTQGGAAFAIRTPLVDLNASPKLGWGVGLWVGTKDVEGLFTHVQKQNAPVIRPLTDGPFGKLFVVADPDGYQITVHQTA